MSRAFSKSFCCNNYNNPTASSSSPVPHGHSKVITWAAIIMLVLIGLVVIGSIAIFGIVRPEKLSFEVEDAYVHNYKITDNHLNATYNITMTAKNNNHKVFISYYDVKMSIECKGDVLASINLASFDLEPRRSTILYERLYSNNVTLSDGIFGGGCQVSSLPQRESGDMALDVHIITKIRFKPRNWRLDGRTIRILCFDVKAHFASSHTVQKIKCDVEL